MVSNSDWTITVVRDIEQIETIRPIWEQMQRKEPFVVPNSDIDRYLAVLRAKKGTIKPYIMVFTQEGRTVSMVIGRIEMRQLHCRVGYKVVCKPSIQCLTIVYGGILGEKNEAICNNVVTKLQSVLKSGDVDMIYFSHLKTDFPIYRLLKTIPNFLCRSHFPIVQSHRHMTIPDNMDTFYQSCSKKHRSNLRRYIRKLEKRYSNQVKCATLTCEDDLDYVFRVISQISSNTYQSGLGRGFVDDFQTRTLTETAANSGWLRVHILSVGEEPCAFQIGLHYGKTYFLEQIGYDPRWKNWNVGTVLFLKVLESLCEKHDVDKLDFGFGDADYKAWFGDQQCEEAGIFLFAPRLRPVLINMLQSSLAGLVFVLTCFIQRVGLVNRIKKWWRKKLQETSETKTR